MAAPPNGAPYGQPLPWAAGEAISAAWAGFKVHGGVLVLSYLLATFVTGFLGQIPVIVGLVAGATAASVPRVGLQALGLLIGQISSAFFQGGLVRIWLAVARGQTPTFQTLFSGADRLLPVLVLNFMMMLTLSLGFVLLIVPGVVLYLGLFAAQFYVIDAGMSPIDAMKASWASTRGQKGEVFVLTIAGFGLTVLGVLMCCFGTLVTIPIYVLSTAIVFTRISGRVAMANPIGSGPETFGSASMG